MADIQITLEKQNGRETVLDVEYDMVGNCEDGYYAEINNVYVYLRNQKSEHAKSEWDRLIAYKHRKISPDGDMMNHLSDMIAEIEDERVADGFYEN